jgi:hypothetical protein
VKWKEFKEWVEASGVEDTDNIEWMDFHQPEHVVREQGTDGEWYVSIS